MSVKIPDGVADQLLQHPGHQNDKTGKKCGQAREGAERRILERGRHLNQVHDDADPEADHQERGAQR